MFKYQLTVDFSASEPMPFIHYGIKNIVRQAIKATLAYEGFANPAEVSVTFCDNKHIKRLNKEYRNISKHTDVLSFPLYDFYTEEDISFNENEVVSLGDIVISVERAEEQARELGNSVPREIAFLTVHSMLHLLGYDHERGDEEEEIQCEAQRDIMKTLDGLFNKEDEK